MPLPSFLRNSLAHPFSSLTLIRPLPSSWEHLITLTTIDSTSSSLVSLLCCLFTFLLTFTFFSLFSFFFSSTVLALEHLVFAHPLPPLFPHRHCLPLSSTHSLTLIILIFQDSITIAGPSSREHLFALTTIDSTRSSLVSLFWLFDCLHFY